MCIWIDGLERWSSGNTLDSGAGVVGFDSRSRHSTGSTQNSQGMMSGSAIQGMPTVHGVMRGIKPELADSNTPHWRTLRLVHSQNSGEHTVASLSVRPDLR